MSARDFGIPYIGEVPREEWEKLGLTSEKLKAMLRKILEIRRFEEKVEELHVVRGILRGPAHLYFGEEAIAVGVCFALRKEDVILGTHRCHGHALAKGVTPKEGMAELFGKATGVARGLGGSMHMVSKPEVGALFSSAIVGSQIPVAVGCALAFKLLKQDRVAAVFFSDGATNTGAFHEGANMAAIWKLPVLFVCENNVYAISMRVDKAVAIKDLAVRAIGYGMRAVVVDGNNALAVYKAALEAAERARKGEGPTFIECKTYRLKGHSVHDLALYRPRDEPERWKERDPIKVMARILVESGVLTEEEVKRMDEEVRAEIEEAVKYAMESPYPPLKLMYEAVYA